MAVFTRKLSFIAKDHKKYFRQKFVFKCSYIVRSILKYVSIMQLQIELGDSFHKKSMSFMDQDHKKIMHRIFLL